MRILGSVLFLVLLASACGGGSKAKPVDTMGNAGGETYGGDTYGGKGGYEDDPEPCDANE